MMVKCAEGIYSFSNVFGKESEACFQGLATFQKWFAKLFSTSPLQGSLCIVDTPGKSGTFSLSVNT